MILCVTRESDERQRVTKEINGRMHMSMSLILERLLINLFDIQLKLFVLATSIGMPIGGIYTVVRV